MANRPASFLIEALVLPEHQTLADEILIDANLKGFLVTAQTKLASAASFVALKLGSES